MIFARRQYTSQVRNITINCKAPTTAKTPVNTSILRCMFTLSMSVLVVGLLAVADGWLVVAAFCGWPLVGFSEFLGPLESVAP